MEENVVLAVRADMLGEDGKAGVAGIYGDYGKNGWDMGYADYSVSRVFTEPWPKYYGLDGNSKLTLDYQTEQSSSNVYCPYKDSIDHNQIYATIKQSAIDIKRQTKYTGHEKARDNSDRKHYALATRKNTILERTIRDTYADYLFMDKMNSDRKKALHLMQTG
ncbi:Protein translocase subunit secA [Anopheles sinensis]|uniref:Protein translocase subunit secA n=1 Tax=Anopheles sinensis TaxID=74873 RepID=A0A084VIP3_ANOSI|nr:Protein translocase subunit secA [Anopheles sinensis]